MNKKDRHHPPRFGEKLFRWILPESEKHTLLGDYEELYKDLTQRKRRLIANLWYGLQIVITIPTTFWNSIKWSVIMIKNYLKIALRNLNRYRTYSIINILGLTLGLTCSFLIFLYIQYEFSFDAFHKNAGQIYRILVNQNHYYNGRNQAAVTPPPFGPAILERVPEVLRMCRIAGSQGFFKTGDRSFYEYGLGVDPDFLMMFDFPLIQGDPKTALNDPFSLILSEEMAFKYFGDENPIGQIITVDDRYDYTVKGITKNAPENTYFRFDFLTSWSTLSRTRGEKSMNSWSQYSYYTFLMLAENADPKTVAQKVEMLYDEHKPDFIIGCEIQNLKDIHFHNKALFELGTTSDIRSIYILSSIGLAILLIACFNYINLATARASSRFREIGIRKVVGAHRHNLIRQFLGESFGYAAISFVITMILVWAVLPSFGKYMQRNIPLSSFVTLQNTIWILLVLVIISIAAGLYPALLLSSFRPSLILRNAVQTTTGRKSTLRNALVVLQFVITTILIASTLVTRKQIDYIRNTDLGYEKESILTFPVFRAKESSRVIGEELRKYHGIQDVTLSSQPPSAISNAGLPHWEGKQTNEDIPFFRLSVDENFLDFYGIPLTLGQKFSTEFATHPENAIILNETAVKVTGWTDPIGKKIFDGDDDVEGKTVIGVVKDFHFASFHIPIAPLMISRNPDECNYISLKIDPMNIAPTIRYLNEKWKTYASTSPFNYIFLEDQLDRMYRPEHRLYQGIQVFAFIAILIACLGLIGLASYAVERKTKEIGIRKVLGGSVPSIAGLLSMDFIKCVLLANILAWPVVYIIMRKWLQNFAYRTSLNIWIFILSGLAALAIALLTVSFQTIKAATANPVEALKYE
jgi:putative ABC transport system permease protein